MKQINWTYLLMAFFVAITAFTIFSICPLHAANTTTTPLKIGFILVGPKTDSGYSDSHNQGRQYLQKNLPAVQTTVVEKVPESAEVERVMEKMIAQGNHLIFCTSYGYLEPAERVAHRHPDVTIMQTWRTSKEKNMGAYSAYQYEPLYPVGIVAGKMTKKNSIGFICAYPIPSLLQNINAFTLGARSVNPKVKVHVVWTNSWADAPLEAEATKSLIDSGVDVVGAINDSPITVIQTAEKNKVMVFGTQADLQSYAPEYWICGSKWNWGPIYLKIAKEVLDGKWKKADYWLGLKDKAVDLSSFGNKVPLAVQKEALAAADKIRQGKFVIFKGPLKDRTGKERIHAGQIADQQMLSNMNWFVDGVEGTLPKE